MKHFCTRPAGMIALVAIALSAIAAPPIASSTHAQSAATSLPIPQESLTALQAAQRRAADTRSSLREREQAVDRAIELRQQIIAQAVDTDERLPGWLMDQAAAIIARLSRDGADTAVLLGIPLPNQREAAIAAANQAASLLRRAEQLLAAAPENEQERTVRIPFFLARAELLLAASTHDDQRRHHATAAHDLINRITLSETSPESIRRVNVALALLLRNAEPADAEIALDELAWVLTREGRDAEAISPLTRAEAWMGLMHASAAMGRGETLLERYHAALLQPPFTSGDLADPLLTVLAHDAATRALFEHSLRTQSSRLMQLAGEQQAELLARTNLPMRAETLRPLVYEKLAMLAANAGDGVELSGPIRTARAVVLARNPEHHKEAIALLRDITAQQTAGPFTPDALWELAVLLTQVTSETPQPREPHKPHEPHALLEASWALLSLAEHHSTSPRAPEAMTAAITFSRSLITAPIPAGATSDTPNQADAAAARETYARALEIATTHYPRIPDIDLWRYERARLLLEEYQRIAAANGDTAAAVTWLENALGAAAQIAPTSAIAADATLLTERLHLARLDALWTQHRALVHTGESPHTFAHSRIAPAARDAIAWTRGKSSPHASRFRLDLIDALLSAADDPRAVHTGLAGARLMIDELMPQLQSEQSPLLPRATLARARLLIASKDIASAFPLLRAVAQQLEPHITQQIAQPVAHSAAQSTTPSSQITDPLHTTFWHAWTLMIEILAREAASPPNTQNAQDQRTPTLRLHIRRLKALDPNLGGPPWQSRILAASPGE